MTDTRFAYFNLGEGAVTIAYHVAYTGAYTRVGVNAAFCAPRDLTARKDHPGFSKKIGRELAEARLIRPGAATHLMSTAMNKRLQRAKRSSKPRGGK